MSDSSDFDTFTGKAVAGVNVLNAATTSPDLAAQADTAAKALGLPPSTVQRNMGAVQQRQAAAAVQSAHPDVVSWLAQDAGNAAVAHDQVSPLSTVADLATRAWADFGGGITGGTATAVSGLGATADALDRVLHGGRLSGSSSAAVVQPFVGFARQQQARYTNYIAERGGPTFADNVVSMAGNIVPAIAAQEGAPAVFGAQGADQAADANAQTGQATTQAGAANVLGNAFVQTAIGAIPVAHYAEGLVPSLGHAAATALAKFGVGTAAAGAQGAAMQIGSNVVSRETVNSGQPLGQGVLDTTGQMALLHALTRLPGAIGEVRSALKPQGDPSALNAAADALHATPMPVRSPDRTADLVGQMTEGKSVFVPAEAVNSFLQTAKPADAQAFLDSTGVEPQLEAATAAGAKVVIPADAYMMSKPAVDALRDHVSLSQDGLSATETQQAAEAAPQALADTGAQVAAAAQADAQATAPHQQVYSEVRQQLRDVGLKGPEADANASVIAARYATRADRLGTDAYSEFQRGANGGGLAFAQGEVDAAQARTLDQPAYHGTPHIFDRFDSGKIGTGEGVQAYGHGLYFAGDKAIADFYRKTVSGDAYSTPDGGSWTSREIQHLNVRVTANRSGTDLDAPLEKARELLKTASDATRPALEHDIAMLERLKEAGGISERKGRLYHVDIPEHDEFLDWDKPLSEQPLAVLKAIKALKGYSQAEEVTSTKGQDLMDELQYRFGRKGASDELHKAGVAGVRYLDANSRGEGDQKHNYVVFDDSRVSILRYEQANRGRIDLPSEGQAIVRLFSQRDKSTISHELGHAFLEELKADAGRDDAPQQVKDDYAAVSQHLGIEGDTIHTEAHETFARGFERYLMEGRAPSEALRGVFQRFKDWLTRIYGNIAGLHANIDPIRGVYDRLLATDTEIGHAEASHSYEPLTQADAGMTTAEHVAYREAVAQAKASAREKLMSKAMKELRATRTKDWTDERTRLRETVAAEVGQRPEVRAWNLLLHGDGEGAPVKLRRADVADAIGDDGLSRLPRGKGAIYADEGAHPDDVAVLTGHDSGEAMLRDLQRLSDTRREARAAGDRRDLPDILTDTETDSHMLAKHGDFLAPDRLEAEAADSIHDDAREKVLQIEHRALERAAGERIGPFTTDALKAYADGVVGRLRTKEVNPNLYLRSERQAGRDAQRALLKGDRVEALAAKRRQLMSFHLYRAAQDAEHDLGVMRRMFTRYARRDVSPRIDQGYFNQISALLARFGFRDESPNTIPPLDDGKDGGWVNDLEKEGLAPFIPTQFRSAYYRTQFSDMSVEEARDLHDSIKSIAHLGAQAKAFTVGGKREVMDDLAAQVAERVTSSKVQAKYDARSNRPVHFIDSTRATLLRAETMADMMDNGDPNGPFNRVYVHGASDANARENELQHGFHKEMAKAYESVPWSVRRTWLRKVDTDLTDPGSVGRPGRDPVAIKINKSDVMGMALNMGNADNMARLTEGFGWDEGQVRDLVNRTLSKDEWHWVQGIWNALESLRKPYFDAEERMTGVRPVPVDATPVETPHGTFEGGYYPVVHDPARSARARDNQEKTLEAAFGRKMSGAATRNGAAQARTEFRAPLKLSPESVIFGHLRDVTKRIAWGEWYVNTQRFLNDSRVQKAVETRLGPDFHNALLKLSKLAVGYNLTDERSLAWAEKLLRASRVNAVNAISGINPRIMFEHAGAHPQSIAVLGKEWWAKGVADYASNPHGKAQFVFDRSPEMVARKDQANREIADLLSDLGEHKDLATTLARKAGLNPDVVSKVREYPHIPVSWINLRLVAMPTWLGGYHKGIAAGMSEEDAIRAGDKAVRVSHSSGAAKDLSIAQSGNEFYRMFTTFFSYHLNQWNLYERSVEGVRQAKSAKDYGRSLESFLWALPAAALVGSLVSGHHPDDLEPTSWSEWAADRSVRSLWEGLPIARNVANYGVDVLENEAKMKGAERPDLFSGIPQASAVKATTLAGEDGFRMTAAALGMPTSKEPSPQWMRHLIAAPGYFLGLPSESPARSAEYLKELRAGDQQPRAGMAGALDVSEGTLFGPPPKTRH